MAETKTKTVISQVGTVIVPVSDQDRATRVRYRRSSASEKRGDIPDGDGERWLDVAPPGAATTIAIVPAREGQSAGIETRTAFATEDVDAAHEHLRSQGVDVDEAVMRMGDPVPPMFFFRDPDGNSFLLVGA